METAYLLLGSNLGDRKATFLLAMAQLSALGSITAHSSLYETKPWGKTDQPDFLNQVFVLETDLEPSALLNKILSIERDLGRIRETPWGPRVIDIDILLYGNQVIQTQELTVPHPQLIHRRFALVPLAEVAGEVIHPVTGLSIQQHVQVCTDPLIVTLLKNT